MKRLNSAVAVMLTAMLSTTFLYSQDWPQFRGPGRDGKLIGFKAPASWPASLTQVWKIKVGAGDASPVLAGKMIYVHARQDTTEILLCIDASTGKMKWNTAYPAAAVKGPSASTHPGPRSTPAISGDRIVTFGATGIIKCLELKSGKTLWTRENPTNEVPQFYTGMSPLIFEGICYVHVGTKDNGTLLAIDMKTGKDKWTWKGDGPAYASPSVMTVEGKKMLILQTEKNLMALDIAGGKVMWQVPTSPQQRFYNCVSPYIDGSKIYYSGQGTGTRAIQVIKQGTGFSTKELWSNPEVGAKWNTPVLTGGHLYGFTDSKRIYCINAADGKTAWVDNTVNSDFATIVDGVSVLIGMAQNGNLIVFKPDPSAYKEVAKYKVSETPLYTYPVISGNQVFVKDAESLILYKF